MIQAQSKSFAELVGGLPSPTGEPSHAAHGTTVLMLRYRDGVLTLADRRATMGNFIVYDHAQKVLALDESTVIAISGSFARSIEVYRFLRHSFRYYRRMYLNEMSLEGKLQEITRVLASNLPAAMQGIGVFLPILCAYDAATDQFGIYFFDGAGARFESGAYACAGSGSERIRGIFDYVTRTSEPWESRTLKDVLREGLRMLDIASDLDSATGGFNKTLPLARVLTNKGNHQLGEELVKPAAEVLSERDPTRPPARDLP